MKTDSMKVNYKNKKKDCYRDEKDREYLEGLN